MQESDSKTSRSKELQTKLKALDRQIALLAERIAKLPESVDPKPLIDHLEELQTTQKKLTQEMKVATEQEADTKLINLDDLKVFRKGLQELILKGESDLELRAKIIRLTVYKIEIVPNGFEVSFFMGDNHYQTALGEKSPSASFFMSFSQRGDPTTPKTKKPSRGNSAEGFILSNFEKNIWCGRSRRLTNGGGGRNRTAVRKIST